MVPGKFPLVTGQSARGREKYPLSLTSSLLFSSFSFLSSKKKRFISLFFLPHFEMLKKNLFFLTLPVLIGLLVTPGVVGWGQEGHSIVAALAQSMLTNRSLDWVCFIENNSTPSLVEICAVPDAYDNTPEGSWSGPMHFVNLPFLADRFEFVRDCGSAPGWHCVVSAIMNYTAILEDQVLKGIPNSVYPNHPTEPSPLSFIIHLLGDIHQRMVFFFFFFLFLF